ncbi:DUF2817 domain-containing protein [Desulfococcaceae bacterium HSG8]|nr:DUF2817 domain-containing protein [Desulfococcaceae bacterium HSG8]
MKCKVSFVFILSFILLTGCAGKKSYPPSETGKPTNIGSTTDLPKTEPEKKKILSPPRGEENIGVSLEGHPIKCFVIGEGRDVTLFLGAMHGNEQTGTVLAHKLYTYFRKKNNWKLLEGRKVVLLPEINPDGVRRGSRNNINGVDINRNFPAENRKNGGKHGSAPLSEPEARAIDRAIKEHNPTRIICLRQVLGCIDYDGPAGDLAAHMGKYCDLSVKKVGSQPGSLGSYAGVDLGIPIITFGMHRKATQEPEALWNQYGKALVSAVVYPSSIEAIIKDKAKVKAKAKGKFVSKQLGIPRHIEKAIGHYHDAEFDKARSVLEKAANKETRVANRQVALMYLALIEMAYDNMEKADRYIIRLIGLNPDVELKDIGNIAPSFCEGEDMTPDIVRRFNSLKSKR